MSLGQFVEDYSSTRTLNCDGRSIQSERSCTKMYSKMEIETAEAMCPVGTIDSCMWSPNPHFLKRYPRYYKIREARPAPVTLLYLLYRCPTLIDKLALVGLR